MIVEWLLDMLETVLVWIGDTLPAVVSVEGLGDWGLVLGYLGDLNYFLPISETFGVMFGIFMLFPALMGVSLLVWLVALIRGGSARG